MTSELTAHLTTGAVVVYAIEWAKKSKYAPFIDANTKKINAFMNLALACAVSVGINYHYDAENRDITIHLPMLTVFLDSCWEWLKQYITQQILYDGIINKDKTNVTNLTGIKQSSITVTGDGVELIGHQLKGDSGSH